MITFDQNIQIKIGNMGNIYIKSVAFNSVVQTIDVNSVSINNSTATITLTQDLAAGTEYYVEISSGVFTYSNNVDYVGFTGNQTWKFTTYNVPAINNISPLNVSPSQKITVTGEFFVGHTDSQKPPTGAINSIGFYNSSGTLIAETTTNIVVNNDSELEVVMPSLTNQNNMPYPSGKIKIKVKSKGEYYDNLTNPGGESLFSGEFNYVTGLVISSIFPGNGDIAVNIQTPLSITFDHNIQKNTGNIYIKSVVSNSIVQTISVNSISINSATATITLTQDLEAGTEYYVEIENDVFRTFSTRLPYTGFNGGATWKFTTYSAPQIKSITGVSQGGQNYISPSQFLSVDGRFFSGHSAVWGGTSIIFYDNSDNAIVEVTDNISIISDSKLSITMPTLFKMDKTPYPAGMIKIKVKKSSETYNTPNAIMLSNQEEESANFSELINYVPLLTISQRTPNVDAIAVSNSTALEITFDQNIEKNNGNIYIKKASDPSSVRTIMVNSQQVTVSNQNKVTVNLNSSLDNGTQYYVQIDEGAFKLQSTQLPYSGINDQSWKFTTDAIPLLNGIDDIMETVTDAGATLNISGKFFTNVSSVEFYDTFSDNIISTTSVTVVNDSKLTVVVPTISAYTDIKIKLVNLLGKSNFSESIKYGGSDAIAVTSRFPSPNSFAVPIGSKYIQLIFNVNIQKSTTNTSKILITNTVDQNVTTINANSNKITTSGNTAKISIDDITLVAGVKYSVTIQNGAFQSGAVLYSGITWSFTTFKRPLITSITETKTCSGKVLNIEGEFFQGIVKVAPNNVSGNIEKVEIYDLNKTSLGHISAGDLITVINNKKMTVTMPDLNYSGNIYIKVFSGQETIMNFTNASGSSDYSDALYYGKPQPITITTSNTNNSICTGSQTQYNVTKNEGSSYKWLFKENTDIKFGAITLSSGGSNSMYIDWKIGQPYNSSSNYKQGDIVLYNGLTYMAKIDLPPSSIIPQENNSWKLITLVVWNEKVYYNKGDLVFRDGSWYKSLTTTSNKGSYPELTTSREKWEPFSKVFNKNESIQYDGSWYKATKDSPTFSAPLPGADWEEISVSVRVVETNEGGCVGDTASIVAPKIIPPPTVVIDPSPESKGAITAGLSFIVDASVTFGGVYKETDQGNYTWSGTNRETNEKGITSQKFSPMGDARLITVTCEYTPNSGTCQGATSVIYDFQPQTKTFTDGTKDSYCQNVPSPITLNLKENYWSDLNEKKLEVDYYALFDKDGQILTSEPKIEDNKVTVRITKEGDKKGMFLVTTRELFNLRATGEFYPTTETPITNDTDVYVGVVYKEVTSEYSNLQQLIKIFSLPEAMINNKDFKFCSNVEEVVLLSNSSKSLKSNFTISEILRSNKTPSQKSGSILISTPENDVFKLFPKNSIGFFSNDLDSIFVKVTNTVKNTENNCTNTKDTTFTFFNSPPNVSLTKSSLCVSHISVDKDGKIKVPDASLNESTSSSEWKITWSSDEQLTNPLGSGITFTPPNADININSYYLEKDYYVTFTGYSIGCKSKNPRKVTYRIINLNASPFVWNKNTVDGSPIKFDATNNAKLTFGLNVKPSKAGSSGAKKITPEDDKGTDPLINFYYPDSKTAVVADRYEVVLKATSIDDIGCYDSLIQQVVVVNTIKISDAASYSINFSKKASTDINWISAGDNIIFEYGIPEDTKDLKKQSKLGKDSVWITKIKGAYNIPNKASKSYLYSPSFDISSLNGNKLVVNINYLMDTDDGPLGSKIATGDGAVLQYSTDANQSKWTNVGGLKDTEYWYNSSPQSQPAYYIDEKGALNTTNDNYGWSGTSTNKDNDTTFVTGKNYVDLPSNTAVIRFRVAFASLSNQKERTGIGFAIKSINLAGANHKVLIENFSNLATNGNAEATQNNFINTLLKNNSGSAVLINYHLNIPKPDPFSIKNIADPSGRAFYYGITKTPNATIDGTNSTGGIKDWGEARIKQQLLTNSDVTLNITMPNGNSKYFQNGQIGFVVEIIKPKQFSLTNSTLHAAIVESEISRSSLPEGTIDTYNTETKFYSILKKLLPSAKGTKLTDITPEPAKYDYTLDWVPDLSYFYGSNNNMVRLQIVAFVQNDITKEVIETKISDQIEIILKDLVSAVEPDPSNMVVTYPNPVDGDLNVKILNELNQQSSIIMVDQIGRQVFFKSFDPNVKNITISTMNLVSGLYFLQVEMSNKVIARKKIIVSHN